VSSFRDQYIPEETEDLKKWHSEIAEIFLRKIGIKANHSILDFGCGAGNYVFPAAKIVGNNGKVYALDSQQIVIDEIKSKTVKLGLEPQLIPLKTDGELTIPLADSSIDLTLIFDVIGIILYKKELKGIQFLSKELNRIAKPGGKLVLALKHTDNWKRWGMSKEEVMQSLKTYFRIVSEEILTHLHWDFLEEDTVIIMSKR
jgi:ubiquinone/menaquinone biosynthesis C-methylase UbiE